MRRVATVALLAALVVAGCSGGGSSGEDADRGPTTAVHSGDPESRFCRLVAEERPALDPFEPGLPADEVETRLDVLRSRSADFADAAPPELVDVLDRLVQGLTELDALLARHGYDFASLAADTDADVSVFDAAEFATAAERITAYREQVCDQEER